jgi:cellulose synthase/poly-beta-1,6-N-acetylglucosamine synthase-like glycosyltransferase
MLRVLVWVGQFLIVFPVAYSSIISLWGFRNQPGTPASSGVRPVRAVVAAHNEATVIAGVAADLSGQAMDNGALRAVVVADRCSDDTAAIASEHVEIAVRLSGDGGKGAAIKWYLDADPLADGEILLVLDADNRVPPDFVARVAAPFDRGASVVQCYLGVTNPDGSVLATASALTYWASNRMVQLARSNIGWSCDLGGTGMAISAEALNAIGGISDDLTDDLALNIRLNLAGYRTAWLHDVRVSDEKPAGALSAVRQRARWVSGKRDVQRAYGRDLVGRGLRRWRPNLLDLAFRLYNPGRSFLGLLVVALAIASAVFPDSGLLQWQYLAALAAVVVLLPVVFLIREGVEAKYVVRYPLVALIAVLWIPVRIVSRFTSSWRRTPHSG